MHWHTRAHLAGLALIGLGACAHAAPVGRAVDPAPEEAPLLALLERGPCHGFCPVYWVRVATDGAVLYEGREFVADVGRRRAHLSPEALTALRSAFADANFFTLEDAYRRRDYRGFPRVTITHRDGDRIKTIDHDLGDSGAPARLLELEETIDRLVGTDAWIGEPDRGVLGR